MAVKPLGPEDRLSTSDSYGRHKSMGSWQQEVDAKITHTHTHMSSCRRDRQMDPDLSVFCFACSLDFPSA